MGYVPTDEPFKTLKNQGLIMASDGRKMSKRWGNVVNPDDVVKTYGADTMRVYEMFMGPFDQSVAWNTDSIMGSRRFLEKVWRISEKATPAKNLLVDKTKPVPTGADSSSATLEKLLHKTIKKISEDISAMTFNTAISAMMILANEMERTEKINKEDYKKFLQILAPFAPHMTEELWLVMGERKSIHVSVWPKYDESKIKDNTLKIAVQINGKVRAEVEISADASEAEVKELTLSNETVKNWLKDSPIKRFIYVKGKLANIVV